MAHSYTPGLRVTPLAALRKERILPLKGEVLAKEGDAVTADQVVARTELPGNVHSVNVANILSVLPDEVPGKMEKQPGDKVAVDDVIARSSTLFGLFKSVAKSPVGGVVESVSEVTGQVLLREPPIPVEVDAYVEGYVVEVRPEEGVVVETNGSLIQGIFGIGGETFGEIKMVATDPNDVLDASSISVEHEGKIIVGGSLVTSAALEKAISCGVRGVVAGGIDDSTIKEFLGYDIGVAITGTEDKGVTVVVTEGFGQIHMAHTTFDLLKLREGLQASINGATQIRAGVIRPEVVVPLAGQKAEGGPAASVVAGGLEPGTFIRIIREPHFGALGKVVELPAQLQKMASEASVRVLTVELENGGQHTLPRANVEIIEG
ncbi:MAG: hypothetical protein DHS20C21_20150 [Gemmatimonadota bacterium]|nr:MAG: hypothetical protein DHS20C21_20150 [Gemmatimonadota bacterium]